MSPSIVDILGDLPPGIHFAPKDDQIVQLYLLPRVRGRPDLIPGLIADDDAAANTQPWELFQRHGLPDDDDAQAFFFVHDTKAKGAARRPDRRCHGGGTWKSQKREKGKPCHELMVDGERVKWSRHNLNLHMEEEEESEGSVGWVMHEYSITTHPSLKLCSIAFTGNGKKRKRVPDGCHVAGERATQRPRVAAHDTSGSGTTTTTFDQGFGTAPHASEHQQPIQLQGSSDEEIAAGMTTFAQEPIWEFQAEQLQQTMMFNQESGGLPHTSEGFQHVADGEGIAAMIAEMTYADPYLEHGPVMDQSSCGVPNIDDTDIVQWEGFDFC